jgi:D-alanyl-D-alanine carboxypeptidase/D-alanyl-D-alanine-endopeptidase (penicillin-binding protein 4)
MRKIERVLFLLLLLAFSPAMSMAQTEVETTLEDNDTLTTDSLWNDSAQVALSLKVDSLPWPQNVQAEIGELLKSDMFQTSQLGMMIWDLDADSAIFKVGERQLLRPASTMKTLTAIVALDKLGGSYQFKTDLCYTGQVDSCTLKGDVYCIGGFDPRFNSDDMRAFVEALKRMGVDTIRGNIYADKSMKDANLLGDGWCWDDDNPVLSPLLISRKDEFTKHFYDQLRQADIFLMGALGEKRKPQDANCIVSRFHTIDQILMRMLKQSDNLYAESMFYQIAASTGERPATAKDARTVINQLVEKLGLNPSSYQFADGSGLSLYNYVSAELEVALLRYAYENENIYHHLLPALPIAGKDGTLRDRMKSSATKGNVRAKTGTLTGISSLCGYLTAYNGHNICFAIINQGLRHGKNGHRFQDRVCTILSSLH